MKKFLLLIAAFLCVASSAFAAGWEKKQSKGVRLQADQTENFLVFGYCQGYETGLGQAGNISAAIEIPAAKSREWVGNKISKVRIGFGIGNNNEITVFIKNSLNGAPIYSQTATITNQEGWNEVELDTPYEIDGHRFYVGYEYKGCKQGEYPIGIDNVPTNVTLGDYIAIGNSWEHVGSMFGSMSIQLVITGDNLPLNDVEITDLTVPFSTTLDKSFPVTAKIINVGANPVETLSVSCSVNGTPVENIQYTVSPQVITSGSHGQLTITGLQAPEGVNVEVAVTIDKVNGVDDLNPANNSDVAYIACFEEGFKRNIVVEEWTGTWCGFCVRGIVGMEYMAKNYSDNFIGIAVHSGNSGQKDPMEVSSYAPFLNKWAIIGFPGCVMNRRVDFDPNKQELEANYLEIAKYQTYAAVTEITASHDQANPEELAVSANVKFAAPATDANYRLAFVIKENNCGPYRQSNYYAGGQYGPLDGWEKKTSSPYVYFNEVARDIKDCFGIEGSIPTSIDKNVEYSYSTTLPLQNVNDLASCDLVVMILDSNTYEVINAAQTSLYAASVEENFADNNELSILTGAGNIQVVGNFTNCTVYGIDGAIIASTTDSTINVAPGIYIVKVTAPNGTSTVRKLIVR